MPSVRINTGPVSYFSKPVEIPPEKWRDLMRAKRDFMRTKIKYDCSCLIEFVEQAQEMWESLGFDSVEDMIRDGYELDPTEIDLAITWLRIKDPESKVGLKEAADRGRKHLEMMKTEPALNKLGENQFTGLGCAEKENGTPKRGSNSAQYRIAKLKRDYPGIGIRMEQGEFKTVAEAERAAGIGRPLKTRLERVIAMVERLDKCDKQRLLAWLESK